MALYTISDLHLPLGIDKPMDVFGKSWENYVPRIEEEWKGKICGDDTVVLPGDFSWATYLEQSKKDFDFLDSLPGKKILLKGNHDYWWSTLNKMRGFISQNGYENIDFLHNTSFMYKNTAICGTRGWGYIGFGTAKPEDMTIYEREAMRLEMSMEAGKKNNPEEILVFMHYPPISRGCTQNRFTELFEKYGVKRCVYGHIHGAQKKNALVGNVRGVEYMLVSCDCMGFSPVKLCD